jgi:bacteriorhodopsin
MVVPESGSLQSLSLWIGTAAMALAALKFLWEGWSVRDPETQEYYVITIFVPAIAAVSYFSMATGFGVVSFDAGPGMGETTIYWARYADWLFTTPLLLLDLCLLAEADRNTIYTLVGLDVFMIGTGVAGALAREGQAVRIVWWAISTGALLVLLYLLFETLSEQASRLSAERASLFNRLRNLVIGLWLLYPAIWIFGTEGGIELFGLGVETALFAVLDVAAKVGFGVILLRSREVWAPETAATATPADD